MPSDPRALLAAELLGPATRQYRSAVASTLEQIAGHAAAGQSHTEARAERLQAQLGPFAGGRIDAARLARLLGDRYAPDTRGLQRLERAAAVLSDLTGRDRDLFHATAPPGGDVAACVSAALAAIGRAFAAGRVASAAQSGASSGLDEDAALEGFRFGLWNAAERRLAPPLLVTVNGADLVAGALAPLLDGMQKILLIVDGPCAPAPLVRLITPDVLVIQAHDISELEALAAWPGTAVGAILPSSAVRFVHDPSAGAASWQRLTVQLPRELRLARLGGFTAAQQRDELRQLEILAARPPSATPVVSSTHTSAGDRADRLAAWLLQQANLTPPAAGD